MVGGSERTEMQLQLVQSAQASLKGREKHFPFATPTLISSCWASSNIQHSCSPLPPRRNPAQTDLAYLNTLLKNN